MNTALFKRVVDKVLVDFPGIDFEIFAYRLIAEVLAASKEPISRLPEKPYKQYVSKYEGGDVKKNCEVCGKEFLGKWMQKMCGEACATERQRQRDNARHQRARENMYGPNQDQTP